MARSKSRPRSKSAQAVNYDVQRSKAYTRLSPLDHQAASNDAELAVSLATQRAKRELIAESQLRRAVTLFSLERYGDTKHPCIGELWFPQASCKENGSLQWLLQSRSPMNIQLTPQFLKSIEAETG